MAEVNSSFFTRTQNRYEIAVSEGLKNVAETTLHVLSRSHLGEKAIELYAFGPKGRIQDERLHTSVAGIDFETPVGVGAGWDKKGRVVRGMYRLGFCADEVGTVPLFGQPGNKQPRMWTHGRRHDVGRNALGFNSIGAEGVDRNLEDEQPFPCPVGVNVGKNKMMPEEQSPWAHAQVVKQLYPYAKYFVFNPSSPNTEGLRGLQQSDPLKAHVYAMREAMDDCGGQKPILVKLAPDLGQADFEVAVDATAEAGGSGLILANTIIWEAVKKRYGLEGKLGGISGNDPLYRAVVTRMIHDAYVHAGDKLEIIGVGGISNAEHVLEYMLAGASLTQLVTSIRPSWGRVAATISRDLVKWMDDRNIGSITELIGEATPRGPKYPAAA